MGRNRKRKCTEGIKKTMCNKRKRGQTNDSAVSGQSLSGGKRQDERKFSRFVWAELKGTKAKWPVKVTERKEDDITVYIRCDNIHQHLKPDDTSPFFENFAKMKEEGLVALKKMPETLKCFKFDVQWALEEYEMVQSDGESAEDSNIKPMEDLNREVETEDSNIKPMEDLIGEVEIEDGNIKPMEDLNREVEIEDSNIKPMEDLIGEVEIEDSNIKPMEDLIGEVEIEDSNIKPMEDLIGEVEIEDESAEDSNIKPMEDMNGEVETEDSNIKPMEDLIGEVEIEDESAEDSNIKPMEDMNGEVEIEDSNIKLIDSNIKPMEDLNREVETEDESTEDSNIKPMEDLNRELETEDKSAEDSNIKPMKDLNREVEIEESNIKPMEDLNGEVETEDESAEDSNIKPMEDLNRELETEDKSAEDSNIKPMKDLNGEVEIEESNIKPMEDLNREVETEDESTEDSNIKPMEDLNREVETEDKSAEDSNIKPMEDLNREAETEDKSDEDSNIKPMEDLNREVEIEDSNIKPIEDLNREVEIEDSNIKPMEDLNREAETEDSNIKPMEDLNREAETEDSNIKPMEDLNREVETEDSNIKPMEDLNRELETEDKSDEDSNIKPMEDLNRELETEDKFAEDSNIKPMEDLNREVEIEDSNIKPMEDLNREVEIEDSNIKPMEDLNREVETEDSNIKLMEDLNWPVVIEDILGEDSPYIEQMEDLNWAEEIDDKSAEDSNFKPMEDLNGEVETEDKSAEDSNFKPMEDLNGEVETEDKSAEDSNFKPMEDLNGEVETEDKSAENSYIKPMEDLNREVETQDESDVIAESDSNEEGSSNCIIPFSFSQQNILGKKYSGLKESKIVRDINYPGLYIRKILKSFSCSKAQQARKIVSNDRVYNNYHACFFCGELKSHVKTHIDTHKDDPEAALYIGESGKFEPSTKIKLLKEGDHKHNCQVIQDEIGEVICARRPTRLFDVSKFGPCPECHEWILLKNIRVHHVKCAEKSSKPRVCKRRLMIQSQVLAGFIRVKPSKMMIEEVFPSITRDEVGGVAKGDPLIIALGEKWLRKSIDNREKRKNYTSGHMRLIARLLIELRKLDGEPDADTKELSHYLRSANFDSLLHAAIQCCTPYMDDIEDLRAPSNGIKLKYDVERIVSLRWAMLVKEDPHSVLAKEMDVLQRLLSLDWADRITKLARSVLVRRQISLVKHLPSPQDVECLTKYTSKQLREIQLTTCNFFRIVQLAETRLLMYNKRRSGEIESLSVASYAGRTADLDDMDESLMDDLTKVEKHLLKTQELMKVRGKRARPVPVIIPEDTKKALAFISKSYVRGNVGIPSSNTYLFPNSAGSYSRAYDSLKRTCEECELRNPSRITSVSMRKYTATLTQLLNLPKHEVEWLCKHLGHSADIHKTFYQQMSGLVERVYVSKLFLVQDLNLSSKYKHKSLKDVDLEEIVFPEQVDNDMEQEESEDNLQALSIEESEPPADSCVFQDNGSSGEEDCTANTDDDFEVSPSPCVKRKVNKHFKRMRWTKKEEIELTKYFGDYLESKICPRRKEVDHVKKLSKAKGGEIWRRSNDKIIKKISNINHQ